MECCPMTRAASWSRLLAQSGAMAKLTLCPTSQPWISRPSPPENCLDGCLILQKSTALSQPGTDPGGRFLTFLSSTAAGSRGRSSNSLLRAGDIEAIGFPRDSGRPIMLPARMLRERAVGTATALDFIGTGATGRHDLSTAHSPHSVPEPEGDHLPDRPEAGQDEHET